MLASMIDIARAPLLFDLDGTLLDTIDDLAASLISVRASFGLPDVDLDFVRRGIGDGLDALLRHGLADMHAVDLSQEAVLEPIRERWRSHYGGHLHVHTRAFEGVEAALKLLADRGHPMAIVSNKPVSFCRQLVRAFAWEGMLPVVLGGDSATRRKPDPAPIALACEVLGVDVGQAWMIGDSPADILAGTHAGCARRVACTWGYRSQAELRAAEPTDVVASFAELLALILAASSG